MFLFLALALAETGEKWTQIATTDSDYEMFADVGSERGIEGDVTVWTKALSRDGQFTLGLMDIDCVENRYRLLIGYNFTAKGELKRKFDGIGYLPVQPNSSVKFLMAKFCPPIVRLAPEK